MLPRQYEPKRVADQLNQLLTSPSVALNTKKIAFHFQSQPLEETCNLIESLIIPNEQQEFR
jgi:hypothetical protein